MVKIEAGKFYRTRDGRKVGPMVRHAPAHDDMVRGNEWPWTAPEYPVSWREDGTQSFTPGEDRDIDLVTEWTEGPVRTVTKKEIVPGVYGEVAVVGPIGASRANVCVNGNLSAAQLRAAAATFLELADALDNA
jgi:hypothetical protein